MTAPRCTRCGDAFEPGALRQTRCAPCETQVAAIVAADAKRRAPRFPFGKETTYGRSAA